MGQLYPPMLPPDIEELSRAYLVLVMDDPEIGTKIPKPASNKTRPDPYLRLEFGGGVQVNQLEYDVDTIVHSYAVNEKVASLNGRTATAHLGAATGETVNGWYIGWCRIPVLPHRIDDPKVGVGFPRYRSMVTWRVQGQPIITP